MRFAIASGKTLRYQDAYRVALWALAAPQAADNGSEGNIWPIDQSAHPTSLSKSPSVVKAAVEASSPLFP